MSEPKKMLNADEALELLLGHARPIAEVERIHTTHALAGCWRNRWFDGHRAAAWTTVPWMAMPSPRQPDPAAKPASRSASAFPPAAWAMRWSRARRRAYSPARRCRLERMQW